MALIMVSTTIIIITADQVTCHYVINSPNKMSTQQTLCHPCTGAVGVNGNGTHARGAVGVNGNGWMGCAIHTVRQRNATLPVQLRESHRRRH